MDAVNCCSFPTTLLILDDDQDFLENIKYALSGQYKCICTSDTAHAHDTLIKNHGWTKSLLEKGVSRIYPGDDISRLSVSMDVPLLKEQVYNSNRFEHIAIVIVDYDMPGKNGLDFIQGLNDSQTKFIMLTGKADQDTVIKAFNERIIHRYVSKGDPNYLQIISQYIQELQTEFFFDFSKFILDTLKESQTNILGNKSFIALFNKIIRDNHIVEYYLLDESGSFLFQDAKAQNQIWLLVKSEEDIEHLHELAKGDHDTPAVIVEQLKNRKSLAHFNTKEESIAAAKHWRPIAAQPLDETKEYYYAIVKNDSYFQMERSKIKSYHEFLKSTTKTSEACKAVSF